MLVGTGWLGAVLFPSVLPLTNLLEWIPPSCFAFSPPFPAQFPELPVLQPFSPASLLTFLFAFFPLGLFFRSCFSAMHFHPGVSFLPALPPVSACLLCSILSKLVCWLLTLTV